MAGDTRSIAAAMVAWKQADARAREIEARLASAWAFFDRRRGPAPSAEFLHEVTRRRRVAQERLAEAVREMHRDPRPLGGRLQRDPRERPLGVEIRRPEL